MEARTDPPWVSWRPWSVDFHQGLVALDLRVERLLVLRGRDVSEAAVFAGGLMPVCPPEGPELDVVDVLPRTAVGRTADWFGLLVAIYGHGRGVVERVADRADQRGGADLGQLFAVADAGE